MDAGASRARIPYHCAWRPFRKPLTLLDVLAALRMPAMSMSSTSVQPVISKTPNGAMPGSESYGVAPPVDRRVNLESEFSICEGGIRKNLQRRVLNGWIYVSQLSIHTLVRTP